MSTIPKIELIFNRTGKLNKRGEALVQIKIYLYDPLTLKAKRKYYKYRSQYKAWTVGGGQGKRTSWCK